MFAGTVRCFCCGLAIIHEKRGWKRTIFASPTYGPADQIILLFGSGSDGENFGLPPKVFQEDSHCKGVLAKTHLSTKIVIRRPHPAS